MFEKMFEQFNTDKNNKNEMISKTDFEAYTKNMQSEMTNIKLVLEQYKNIVGSITENKDDAQIQTQAQDIQAQAQDIQAQAQKVQAQAQPQGQAQEVQMQKAQAQGQAQGQAQNDFPAQIQVQPQTQIQIQPQGGQAQEGTEKLPVVDNTDTNQEIFNKIIQYINFIGKQLEVVMGHSDVLSEMLNRSINYSEKIGTTLNEHINYTNATNKLLNETINYTNELAGIINHNGELFEKSVGYLNLVGTRLNETIELSNVISEQTNNVIKFNEYSAKLVNEHIDFTNVIANVINSGNFTKGAVSITDRNLSDNVANINESYNNIITSVDKVLSTVADRSNSSVLENKFPFLKLLEESNKNTFYGLDTDTKIEVVSTLEKGVYFNESDVMSVIHGIMENKNSDIPSYVRLMPDKYKQVYESMSANEKSSIHQKATSGFFKLNTPYQIKSFWDSQGLNGRNQILQEAKILEKQQGSAINENKSQSTEGTITFNQLADMQRGYSKDFIQNLTRHAGNH